MRGFQTIWIVFFAALAAGFASESRAQTAEFEERIATCMAAQDPDCLLDAAISLAPIAMSGGSESHIGYRIVTAQLHVGDRAGALSMLGHVHPYGRFRLVWPIADRYWIDGDIEAALNSAELLDSASDRAKLMAVIGVAQFRSGDLAAGRQTIDAAEREAWRGTSIWGQHQGLLAVIRARAEIGELSAASNLLTRVYRTARNGGADRMVLSPLESQFAKLGDIEGVREVLAHTSSGRRSVQIMLDLARALLEQGDVRSVEKYTRLAFQVIADADDYGGRFPLGRMVDLQTIAGIQNEMGRPDAALSTLMTSLKVAEEIRAGLDPNSDDPEDAYEYDQVVRSVVETHIMIADIGGDGSGYSNALDAATQVGRLADLVDLQRQIGRAIAISGDIAGAESVLTQAFSLARDYARDSGDYERHLELAWTAEANGFEDLSGEIVQDAVALMRDFARKAEDLSEIDYVAGLQASVGDVDGVVATLQHIHTNSLGGADSTLNAQMTSAMAAFLASNLASSGFRDGAYRVAEFGLTIAQLIPTPSKRASAFIELALSPENYYREIPTELPFDDIVSPR